MAWHTFRILLLNLATGNELPTQVHVLKLAPRFADNFMERMDHPPAVHLPRTYVASPNSSIASSTVQWIPPDRPIHYFGLREVAVVGEERLHSRTELKWGEAEAMGFRGSELSKIEIQSDLTNTALTYLYSVMLFFFHHSALHSRATK